MEMSVILLSIIYHQNMLEEKTTLRTVFICVSIYMDLFVLFLISLNKTNSGFVNIIFSIIYSMYFKLYLCVCVVVFVLVVALSLVIQVQFAVANFMPLSFLLVCVFGPSLLWFTSLGSFSLC